MPVPPFPPESPQRVLIVKPSALGDIVHALPVAGLIKRRWPEARLSWLVARPFAPLLETNPHVDEVIPFERQRGGRFWRHSANARRLGRRLREAKFDLVLDLQGLFRSGWLTWRTGAAARVGFGYAREGAAVFYTQRVGLGRTGTRNEVAGMTNEETRMTSRSAYSGHSSFWFPHSSFRRLAHSSFPRLVGLPQYEPVHAVERYLDIAEAVTGLRGPVEFPLITTEEDEARVEEMLALGAARASGDAPASRARRLTELAQAVLLPGTNWATKRWSAERFAELGRRLGEELGMEIIIAGGADAAEAAALIVQENPDALNLVGRTGVRELVVLLRRAGLVVSNDSGPMHLAAALGRPLVAPFGPTSPWRTGPYGRGGSVVRLEIPCSPCFSRQCVHQSCLQELGVEAVLERCRAELAAVT